VLPPCSHLTPPGPNVPKDGVHRTRRSSHIDKTTTLETFFAEAANLNPSRTLIKGVVCGIRVENVEDPLMREVRYLDKLIDELAKGKAMENILRGGR
jgi:hypothetical protein